MFVGDLPPWLLRGAAFVFGALWGSFFNVAIHRWPREMSVVSPPSQCPHCATPIPFWRNLPIVGYLLLRGRAACCGARLTPRYLFVELASAVLALAVAERFLVEQPASMALEEAAVGAVLFFFFVGGLLIATFVDFEWLEIPDEVSIGGTALGLATISLRAPLTPDGPDALDLAIGAGAGYLVVYVLLVWSWERLTGRRGMGEGDPKLLMFIGAFLGWRGALFALVAGAAQGMVFALLGALRRERGPEGTDEPEGTERDAEADAAADEDARDRWVPPAPLTLTDGTTARARDGGRELEVEDARGRLLWDYRAPDPDAGPLGRALPFGPFLALGALEFLFFGRQLVDAYLSLFFD